MSLLAAAAFSASVLLLNVPSLVALVSKLKLSLMAVTTSRLTKFSVALFSPTV